MRSTNISASSGQFKFILIKLVLIIFLSGLFSNTTYAQSHDFTGLWTGVLEFGNNRLDIGYKIEKKGSGYYTKMYVPQQSGDKGLVMSVTNIEKNTIAIASEMPELQFNGVAVDSSHIEGKYSQNKKEYTLKLVRTWGTWPVPKPQTPLPPFHFTSEELILNTGGGRIKLAGSLHKPDTAGKYPLVILLSGSGAQDRDSRIGQHKPFLLLTDRLTKAGFAVMRFDDRGAGKSTGHPDFIQSTTTLDLVNDALEMVKSAKNRLDIDANRIFLLGHSEGAQVAVIAVASDTTLAGLIMLAGPAISGKETNIYQNQKVLKDNKFKNKTIHQFLNIHGQILDFYSNIDDKSVREDSIKSAVKMWEKKAGKKAKRILYKSKTQNLDQLIQAYDMFAINWWKTYLKLDISKYLETIQKPVLALNGDKDVQVEADRNLDEIRAALSTAKNQQSEIIKLPGLNHLFQQCKTCEIMEYYTLDETMNEVVLHKINVWLIDRVK